MQPVPACGSSIISRTRTSSRSTTTTPCAKRCASDGWIVSSSVWMTTGTRVNLRRASPRANGLRAIENAGKNCRLADCLPQPGELRTRWGNAMRGRRQFPCRYRHILCQHSNGARRRGRRFNNCRRAIAVRTSCGYIRLNGLKRASGAFASRSVCSRLGSGSD